MAKRKNNPLAHNTPGGPYMKRLPSGIIVPMTPNELRKSRRNIMDIAQAAKSEKATIDEIMESNPVIRAKVRQMQKHAFHLAIERSNNGSGFQLSNQLRWYFQEYANRIWNFGPDSFPSSFNIVEAFMHFDTKYFFFDLNKENEHLLSIDDYFEWYDGGGIPKKPDLVKDLFAEGVIYSYEMQNNFCGLKIAGLSQQVIAGISFIRHDYELSCMLLAGENPPLHTADEIDAIMKYGKKRPGREEIECHPNYSIEDRYLEGYPGFGKVIVLARFDLRNGKYDVRYVQIDEGSSFNVLTDDLTVLDDLTADPRLRESIITKLSRYDSLFSSIASLIYLPAYFVIRSKDTKEVEVATALKSEIEEASFRKTVKALGESNCVMTRKICCLPCISKIQESKEFTIQPPELHFQSEGYWKAIGPHDLGEDKNKNPIVGRTWVSRVEIWSARPPGVFLLERASSQPSGPDPGEIYIQRSPSHGPNIYKIGLTRRNSELRAKEISSATGVPLPLTVVATWRVGDCGFVERTAHQRLNDYRISQNREFFFADLQLISKTIIAIIEEIESQRQCV